VASHVRPLYKSVFYTQLLPPTTVPMLRELPEGSLLSPTLFGIVLADLARVNHLKGNSQTQQFFTTHNTLSSSEAEFVAASQAGPEVLYLRALLTGFAYLQHGLTEIWKDNASCILMSENPTNRERSRHVDVRIHFFKTWCEMDS